MGTYASLCGCHSAQGAHVGSLGVCAGLEFGSTFCDIRMFLWMLAVVQKCQNLDVCISLS